jgi:succinate dehydrogenase / fumarate reductase membrane anchor subunit
MKSATGAHTGTGVWLMQRATALLLGLAMPVLVVYALTIDPLDFSGWKALWAPLSARVWVLLVAVAMALHAWVGMRDIFMDYVHPTVARLALSLAVVVVLGGSVVWLAAILFGSNPWGSA